VIFRYLAVVQEAPEAFLILIAAFTASLLAGLVLHEVAHAYVADSLGDPTPRRFGRLSLNPRRHLDPLGSALIFFVGFGWAKPVPVNPANTGGNVKRNMAMIALAGPATNLVIAGLAGLPIKLGYAPFFHPFVAPSAAELWARVWTDSPENLIGLFLGTIVLLNVILAIFNLLPLAPLDGFRVALGLLPVDLAREFARLEPWGPGVLLVLIFLPFIGGPSLLFDVLSPFIDFFLRIFVESSDLRVV
jgi:Zn-dependent protease